MAATANETTFTWGTGRRKTAVARVRIREGTGQFQVNGLDCKVYFPLEVQQMDVQSPLAATDMVGRVDVVVNVRAAASPASPAPSCWAWPGPSRNSAPTSTPRSATAASSPATPEWWSARNSATRRPARASSSRSGEQDPRSGSEEN